MDGEGGVSVMTAPPTARPEADEQAVRTRAVRHSHCLSLVCLRCFLPRRPSLSFAGLQLEGESPPPKR